MADDVTDKFVRNVRAGLNELLDRLKEAEAGGTDGFEHIGHDHDPNAGAGAYTPPKPESEKTLRDYYANLELEYGASMDEVKVAYREMMRRYHPDKYSSDPKMAELSTQISQELTRAYRAIEAYWETGGY